MTERANTCQVPGDKELERVRQYMLKIAENPFKGTATGAVLDDVLGSSGKMLRPRLLLQWGSLGPCFSERSEKLCLLAAMVELTHMASLVHDDIIDEAPTRRGLPSIQRRYGKDAAVYAGDFLISRVNYWEAKEQLAEEAMILSETVEKMCIGEIGQAVNRFRKDVTVERYISCIKGKTASLFDAACRLGALDAGCGEEIVKTAGVFGEYLGIMFQLRDDLLDFTSTQQQEGKETHKDFLDGIYTMPLLMAMRSEEGRNALMPFLEENAKRRPGREELAGMESEVKRFGGVAATIGEIHRYAALAGALLDQCEALLPEKKTDTIRRILVKIDTVG